MGKRYRVYWTDRTHLHLQLTHPIQHLNDTQRPLDTPSSRRPVRRDKRSMEGDVCERDEVDRHKYLIRVSWHRHRCAQAPLKQCIQCPETRSKRGRLTNCMV